KADEVERLKQEVQKQVGEVLSFTEQEHGVMIKSDTIGGLEALRHLLEEKNIPIASASLGDLTKKDLSNLETLKEKDEFTGVLLGFNVKIAPDVAEYAKVKGLTLILNEVIYKTIEDYEKYVGNLKKEIEKRELANLVRPCKFLLMKGYVFRQSNPAIIGVDIEVGKIRTGDPIMRADGMRVSSVKSLGEAQESVTVAEQGKQLAMAMDGVTIGRQVKEGDYLYTDIPEEHFKKLKELKKNLSKRELEVLKEIAEIKRKENPVWGVG
ncbi:MAG: translation initiation factor IF-2, partial [Nanoarchaeota archaeon]